VPKSYFSCIIQYIYSDHFYIQKQEPEFYIKLLIYADYFMLPRLIDICSSYLKGFVNHKTALNLYLLAHAHNADQLEGFCVNYIAMHEQEIMESRQFRLFKRKAQDSLYKRLLDSLQQEKLESFVQICINNYLVNRSGKGSRYPAFNRSRAFDGEIDIEPMLQVSQYIYLEEHQRLETYDLSASCKRDQTIPISDGPKSHPRSMWPLQEESKGPLKEPFCFNEEEDEQTLARLIEQSIKENINPNQLSPLAQRRRTKTHAMSLRPRLGSGSLNGKKKERKPLQAIKQARARGEVSSEEELSEEETM